MDKLRKRTEATDKKIEKVTDRGDQKKPNEVDQRRTNEKPSVKKVDVNTKVNTKIPFPDRGDSERKVITNQKIEKIKTNSVVKKSTNEEMRIRNAGDNAHEKEIPIRKNTDNKPYEFRKRIRDKYTLKLKNINKIVTSNANMNKAEETKDAVSKNDVNKTVELIPSKKQMNEQRTTRDKSVNSPESSGKTNNKQPDKDKRKPMIKTIMSKNGSVKIYKAVTFVDQKRPSTPLQINIPVSLKKPRLSKATETSSMKFKTKATVSRASIKNKPVTVRKKSDKKQDQRRRQVPSPENSTNGSVSPPTEVARWAPSCLDKHTKPYYEAWVNTTLAAISKSSKKDKKFFEKQRESLLKSFQRVMEERSRSPELYYENFADEMYTGRIKIRQR